MANKAEIRSATHLMIVPSLACPAGCAYCFGPHIGREMMDQTTIEAIIRWQKTLDESNPLEITFHGGEPLVPGISFYRMTLPLLRESLSPRSIRFAMQSNLWLLTDELCELLKEERVSIGTSLDGPEVINDAQRGTGYFQRTMTGIHRARSHGLDVGCICTFTAQSLPHLPKILSFFISEGLNFSLHAALPSLSPPKEPGDDPWSLSAQDHADMFEQMLAHYLPITDRIRISTLDSLCRSVSAGHGSICTFGDCLGSYLSVSPDGSIYPCQRFAGKAEYALGNVHANPTPASLAASPTWQKFQQRQEHIQDECGDCIHLDLCRGGCPYNALADGGGTFRQLRDPHCAAYQRIFSHITEQATAEVFSEANITALVEQPHPKRGLLQQGRLLNLIREGPHPYETAGRARLVLASVALASTGSPHKAAAAFEQLGLVTNPERTMNGMVSLQKRLLAPIKGLNNIYIHVTFACPLRCTHCYAEAGQPRQGSLPVEQLTRTCHEAASLGFRHAVITGGEPLVHPRRDVLLDALADLRSEVKPLLTVLRTSLSLPLDDVTLRRISNSSDQVVVSLDGDRQTHDERRGQGSYALVVENLRRLVAFRGDTDLSLAAVLPLAMVNGPPGESVRNLSQELGIRRTRFRPLLPLGRAADTLPDIAPETLWGHMNPDEMIAYGFSPVSSCGMGQNLYIEPDGKAFPCYAWHGKPWQLGVMNGKGSLADIVTANSFQELGKHNVNTNHACRGCALRYLCGGACRAWSRLTEEDQTDLDAAPLNCNTLQNRARSLLINALERLGISQEEWMLAGLAGIEPLVVDSGVRNPS